MTQEIYLTIPADHQYLNLISSSLQALFERYVELSDKTDLLYNIQLGVHEVCTNIVEHAYKGTSSGMIEITFDVSQLPQHLEVTLSDTGKSFDPESVNTPNLDDPQIHGYGLFLVHELLDNVEYRAEDGVNYWVLRKNLIQD